MTQSCWFSRYDRRIIIQLPHDSPPDSPLLDEMDVSLPSVTRDPVSTFQRLMALRADHSDGGLMENQRLSFREDDRERRQRLSFREDDRERRVTRIRDDMFSSSPLEDREVAWTGSDDWVRMAF